MHSLIRNLSEVLEVLMSGKEKIKPSLRYISLERKHHRYMKYLSDRHLLCKAHQLFPT